MSKKLTITLELRDGTAGEVWIGVATNERGVILRGVILHVDAYHDLVIEALRGLLAGHDPRR